MIVIATAQNNGFTFGKEIKLEEGKEYRVVIEEIKSEIDPELLELVGIIKNEKIDDEKEYISKKLMEEYENTR